MLFNTSFLTFHQKMPRTVIEEENEIFEDARESLTSRTPRSRPTAVASRSGRTVGAVGGSGDVRNGRGPSEWQSVLPQVSG